MCGWKLGGSNFFSDLKSDENNQRGRQEEVGESELSICFTFEGD